MWITNKLKSIASHNEELRSQINDANERKKTLEKELEVLQSSESQVQYARLFNELQLTQTLLSSELMFSRWFVQKLDQTQREISIIEKDLERIKSKGVHVDDVNKEIKSKDEEHYVNMLVFEEEKSRFLEVEKNKISDYCKQSLQKLKEEYDQCCLEKQKVGANLAKFKLDFINESDRRKELLDENSALRARMAEAKSALNRVSYRQLLQMKQILEKEKKEKLMEIERKKELEEKERERERERERREKEKEKEKEIEREREKEKEKEKEKRKRKK